METFVFKWRRRFFWHAKEVTGFVPDNQRDRMALFFKDGTCYEISRFSRCDSILGTDYFKVVHKQMEQKAGQSIPVRAVV